MDWTSQELVSSLSLLLPGFLAAWVFYGLTAHRKPSAFERLVEAFIFTIIVRAITIVVREALLLVGRAFALGAWTEDAGLLWSVLIAVLIGIVFAKQANNDRFHGWIRKLGWSTRTSFPSEWYSAFAREKRWIVLHLTGKRRLYGWPEEWPDEPDAGHFLIVQAEWLLPDGQRAPLHQVEKLVVPARDVEMCELLRDNDEVTAEANELQRVERLLTRVEKEEIDNGNEDSAASAQSAE